MATTKKVETVKELTEKISKAKNMVFADFAGLKHKQLEELRRDLKKADAEFVVTKNKLMIRALGDSAGSISDLLKSSTATLFAYADEVAPLKTLLKFFKTAAMGKTKGAFMGKSVLSDSEVTRLASLPTRDVLLGRLVGQLNAPIQKLHYALSWNINKLVWALEAVKNTKDISKS